MGTHKFCRFELGFFWIWLIRNFFIELIVLCSPFLYWFYERSLLIFDWIFFLFPSLHSCGPNVKWDWWVLSFRVGSSPYKELKYLFPCSSIFFVFLWVKPCLEVLLWVVISWRLKWWFWSKQVHAHFGFGPLCAYLSINYLDRFLSVYELPVSWGLNKIVVSVLIFFFIFI